MNVLDWVLVTVVLAYALSGYWQGFVTGAFATTGLLAGGALGIWLVPIALGDAAPSIWVTLAAIFLVILAASLGQASLQHYGARIREKIAWQPVRAVDAIGGALLAAMAVLLVAWALGVAISGSRITGLTPQVRSSAVLAQVDSVLPAQARGLLNQFNNVVGTTFFPRYLEPFAPERIVAVDPPPADLTGRPGIDAARESVLKVVGNNRCGRGVEGSGFLYADDRLMTNAHVVAGVNDPFVVIGGERRPARVVHYDPQIDVAVLAVDDGDRRTLSFNFNAGEGDPIAILGYPNDGPYDVQGGRIRAEQRLRSPDIYGRGSVLRDVYSVRGLIRPGNSGGPLVSPRGDVVGVVFAASVTDADTGYALTAEQVREAAAAGVLNSRAVDTGNCATG
ncbi:MarP family serine protease [Nocardioides limicola]|uniref:MarP family serine protease n=1 Tax=Nocardioides limicola TaxID=2803368 RepID=UPI00193BED18|nr:MarP family serine protease [Nocardioides sp. DJM-14]